MLTVFIRFSRMNMLGDTMSDHIINIKRFSDGGKSTLGLMFLDGIWECYTLEDTHRDIKIMNETRIPEGEYNISICTWGDIDKLYMKKYPEFHKGMIQLDNVPGFTGILIHQGGTREDTSGCILVGDSVNNNKIYNGQIISSAFAYQRMYEKVIKWVMEIEKVKCIIETLEPIQHK